MDCLSFIVGYCEKNDIYCTVVGSFYEDDLERSEQPKAIVLADLNQIPSHIYEGVERRGVALEYDDEWIVDYQNDRCFKIHPTHYGWTPNYMANDWTNGEVIGADEIRGDLVADYIEEYLLNDPNVADIFNVDLDEHGFEEISQHSYGCWGVADEPTDILAALQEKMPDHDFVFSVSSVGQFSTEFTVWARAHTS